jgi:serine/threonine-protein kinase RsbW
MEFVICNQLNAIYDLESRILEEIGHRDFDENSCFAIRLALDEALVNAYRHGNREDLNKQIKVRLDFQDDQVAVEVEDEGDGFDWRLLPDPRTGEQIDRTNGRGIFLIRQFMETAHFNEKGNRIRFTFHKRLQTGKDQRGPSHWKYVTADILELDPVRVGRDPTVILESVDELLEKGATQILVDLKFLDRIDSACLGFLVAATREVESRGGCLTLVRPQLEVERIIRATSLDVVLKIYGDLPKGLEACESFLGGGAQ